MLTATLRSGIIMESFLQSITGISAVTCKCASICVLGRPLNPVHGSLFYLVLRLNVEGSIPAHARPPTPEVIQIEKSMNSCYHS